MFSPGDCSESVAFPRMFLLPGAIFCPSFWSRFRLSFPWNRTFLREQPGRNLASEHTVLEQVLKLVVHHDTVSTGSCPISRFLKSREGRAAELRNLQYLHRCVAAGCPRNGALPLCWIGATPAHSPWAPREHGNSVLLLVSDCLVLKSSCFLCC